MTTPIPDHLARLDWYAHHLAWLVSTGCVVRHDPPEGTMPQRANLRDANLREANLRDANLRGADLRDANLRDANLRDADLRDANLRDANLRGADLWDADLRVANLWGANLRDANLRVANLRDANLRPVRDDVRAVLDLAPDEAPAVLAALEAGRVDGSVYEGACACLVGTIANVRGVPYTALGDLRPNASRPAERWFMGIRRGDTPATSPIVDITAEWVREWIAEHPATTTV
jgi:hypothetical protein